MKTEMCKNPLESPRVFVLDKGPSNILNSIRMNQDLREDLGPYLEDMPAVEVQHYCLKATPTGFLLDLELPAGAMRMHLEAITDGRAYTSDSFVEWVVEGQRVERLSLGGGVAERCAAAAHGTLQRAVLEFCRDLLDDPCKYSNVLG